MSWPRGVVPGCRILNLKSVNLNQECAGRPSLDSLNPGPLDPFLLQIYNLESRMCWPRGAILSFVISSLVLGLWSPVLIPPSSILSPQSSILSLPSSVARSAFTLCLDLNLGLDLNLNLCPTCPAVTGRFASCRQHHCTFREDRNLLAQTSPYSLPSRVFTNTSCPAQIRSWQPTITVLPTGPARR